MTRRFHAVVLLFGVCACSAADTRVDPAELSLRDLLGMSPEVAAGWSDSERAAARGVIEARLDDAAGAESVPLGAGRTDRQSMIASLDSYDRLRDGRGRDAVPLARADLDGFDVIVSPIGMAGLEAEEGVDAPIELKGWDRPVLAELARTRRRVIVALARASGGTEETLRVEPAEQVGFGAARLSDPPALLVNPVLLAAVDPEADADAQPAAMRSGGGGAPSSAPAPARAVAAGNPYAFYGSVAECAAAERLRCESCLPSSTCDAESRDASDGNAECTALAADDGVGYFLFCANLALAIRTVETCTGEAVPGCTPVSTASNQISALDANRDFVDDPVCRDGLDSCLSKLYGDPADDYPGPPSDAGPSPEPPPARDPTASCGGSDTNCDFSPQCSASCGDPDCSNTIDCNSSCDDSSSGSSSGGCGGCGSDSSSSGGGSCSSCGSDSSSSGSGCDSSCGSSNSGGSGCGSCSNDSSGGSGCGGSCGGSNSSGNGCGSSSSSSSSCSASGATARHTAATAVAVIWAMFPLPLLMWLRRRERRRSTDGDDGGES